MLTFIITYLFCCRLKVGVQYVLTVTAANSRGSSPPVTLNYTASAASAHRVVSPNSRNGKTILAITPFLMLAVGMLVAVSACVGVGIGIARRLRRKKASGAKILYAGPLKDPHENHDVHTILCANRGE